MDIISAAISHFEYGISHDIFTEPVTSYARAAVSALRAQKEKQPNAPLAMDELWAMNGEPVYIVSGDMSWWDIVGHSSNYLILKSGEALPYKKYGEWLAYRYKPEEV